MTGDGIDVQAALSLILLAGALAVWAVLVSQTRRRMRQEKRLRRHAERVAREHGIDKHPHEILVDERNARTMITWFEDGTFHHRVQQWSNRMDDEWYIRNTPRHLGTARTSQQMHESEED